MLSLKFLLSFFFPPTIVTAWEKMLLLYIQVHITHIEEVLLRVCGHGTKFLQITENTIQREFSKDSQNNLIPTI